MGVASDCCVVGRVAVFQLHSIPLPYALFLTKDRVFMLLMSFGSNCLVRFSLFMTYDMEDWMHFRDFMRNENLLSSLKWRRFLKDLLSTV